MPGKSRFVRRSLALVLVLHGAALLAQDAVRPAARLSPELRQLFANVSDRYLLDGIAVPRERDRSVLRRQVAAENRHQRRLATMTLGLERLADAFANGTELKNEPGSTIAEFHGVVLSHLARELSGDRQSLGEVVSDLTGDGGVIARGYEEMAKGMTGCICDAIVLQENQSAMQALQESLPPSAAALAEDAIEVSFAAVGGEACVVLGNLGETTLRDCAIVCRYRPDIGKVLDAMARREQGEQVAWIGLALLGVADDTTRAMRKFQLAQVAFETLDKGSLVHVPEWKPGSIVQLSLASIGSIVHAAGSAELSIWCDAGAQQGRALDLDECRRVLGAPPARAPGAADADPPPASAPIEFDASLPQASELHAATEALDAGEFAAARAAFEAVKKALTRSAGDATTRRMLMVARYRLGEALQRLGMQKARQTRDDSEAERLLRVADSELQAITGDDFATRREGSSLRAAALRGRVTLHGILYEGYLALAKEKPSVRTWRQKRDSYRETANRLFRELEKSFADATLPDGRRVVDVAREEALRLMR